MNEFDDNDLKQEELSENETDAEFSEDADIAEMTAGEVEKAEVSKPFSNAVDWVCTFVFTAAAVLFLNLFLFRAITVDGTSMCDTLQDGDIVITTGFAYNPSFGDIVTIQADKLVNSETKQFGEPIIKRVIGVAGDTIRFDLDKGEVYRNGELLTEDYILGPTNQWYTGWVENGKDYVVPEHCVFVLGDNRRVSHDSRDMRLIGFVDENYVMGKALVRIFPLNQMKWL